MIKDLLEVSKDRIKNPFIASFLIAAIIINWRFLLFMTSSSLPIQERISYAEQNYIHWIDYLLLPAIVAAFYTLALPYIMLGIDHLLKDANNGKIKAYYAQEVTRTQEKSILAAEEVKLELIKANSNDLNRANEQIEQLKNIVEQKEESIQNFQKKYNELQSSYDTLRNENLNLIDRTEDEILPDIWQFLQREEIFKVFNEVALIYEDKDQLFYDEFLTKHHDEIQELLKMHLISMGGNSNGDVRLTLTKKGEKLWEKIMEASKNRNHDNFKKFRFIK